MKQHIKNAEVVHQKVEIVHFFKKETNKKKTYIGSYFVELILNYIIVQNYLKKD